MEDFGVKKIGGQRAVMKGKLCFQRGKKEDQKWAKKRHHFFDVFVQKWAFTILKLTQN